MKQPNHSGEVVALTKVSKHFGWNGQTSIAVRDVSLYLRPGELALLNGPSGSGKTTLLNLMAGLIKPTHGDIALFGKSIVDYSDRNLQILRAKRIGFVFQNFLLIESLTVIENLLLVLQFGGMKGSEARVLAKSILRRFQIEHLAQKLPTNLSQGEKQRVAVARAVANGGELIIADEPTASLESNQGFDIIRLLHRLAKEDGKCVVVATHDMRLTDFADRIFRMKDGEIMDGEHR